MGTEIVPVFTKSRNVPSSLTPPIMAHDCAVVLQADLPSRARAEQNAYFATRNIAGLANENGAFTSFKMNTISTGSHVTEYLRLLRQEPC